jgi:hypothetical protein
MRILLLVAMLAVGATSAQAQPTENLWWRPLHNARYGFQLEYPAGVFEVQRSSTASDGELFRTRDGSAKLLIGAFENVDHRSPASYQRYIARDSYPGLKVDYAPVGPTWSVLSGTQGDDMVYEKMMLSCGGQIISSFAMIYPTAERAFYDPIVEVIEDSFRPGGRCDQHAARN